MGKFAEHSTVFSVLCLSMEEQIEGQLEGDERCKMFYNKGKKSDPYEKE